MNTKKTAISPTRAENYPEWYQQVVRAADMAETSPVRGCMIIKPNGYGIWENIQKGLDTRFKATGHQNVYFPLLIPKSFLEQEAEHVDGFAKECAVVTHHRLEADGQGGLKPAGPLEEPLIIRPTSETIIGDAFSRWVQSHRDLPIKINQWANVMRWEMRTRMFLRTSEFLWQEGHTVHATSEEAMDETKLMLETYAEFAESQMAIPVIRGEKSIEERFPGAVTTYSIEAMMQDRKALQAGTSHFLGQNFSKAQGIKFQNDQEQEAYGWTTSWGVSTRLVGALIMTHSDDNGLVVPPNLAPTHVVLSPIIRKDDQKASVMEYCQEIKQRLQEKIFNGSPLVVEIDDREIRGGEKKWQHIKKGIPLRVEAGPRDIESGKVFVGRRDMDKSEGLDKNEFIENATSMLQQMQQNLFDRALKLREENTHQIDTLDQFKDFFSGKDENKAPGFASCHWAESPEMYKLLSDLKVTHRCAPMNQEAETGKCLFSGAESSGRAIFAKAY